MLDCVELERRRNAVLPRAVTRGRLNPRWHSFPERLRKARKARGLNRTALSVAAGMSPDNAARFEEAVASPRLYILEQLADALRVSPAWLAYGAEVPWEPAGELRCGNLASRAKEARELRGLSLREVGRRMGSYASAVQAIERGTMPSIDTAETLANALGLSPAWLAFGEGPRELPRRRSQPTHSSTGAHHASPQAYVPEKPQHDRP